MLLRGAYDSFAIHADALGSLSDHAALAVTLPWTRAVDSQPDMGARTVYRWVEGSSLADYSCSWRAWNKRTDSEQFA